MGQDHALFLTLHLYNGGLGAEGLALLSCVAATPQLLTTPVGYLPPGPL